MHRRALRVELLTCIALYTLLYGVMLATGWRMQVRWELLHLLTEETLRGGLLEAMWYLHAQPPMLNFVLGLALELEAHTGLGYPLTLGALQFGLGLGTVVFWSAVASRLIASTALRRTCLAILVLHPVFYASLFNWFYTLHEVFLLSWIAWATFRLLDRPGLRAFVGVGIPVILLVLTRTLFHPLWAMLYLGGCAVAARPKLPARESLALLGVTAVLLLAWPAKNLLLFGFFGYSSWQGFHASRGLELGEPPISPMFQPGRSPESILARSHSRAQVPQRFRGIPSLVEPEKRPGIPNWHHYAMIPYSQKMQGLVLSQLRHEPLAFLTRAWRNYLKGWSLYASRNAYYGYYEPPARRTWVAQWMNLHEHVLFPSIAKNPTVGPPGAFAFLFPLALACILVSTYRHREHAAFVLLQLCTLGWVLAMVLLVDGQEGNRMRFSTEPIYWLLLAGAVSAELTARRRSPAPSGSDGSGAR